MAGPSPPLTPPPDDTPVRCWPLPLLVAVLAWIGVLATLDSSGAVPWLAEGPGLTLDETFNVQMGVYHVRAFHEYGLSLLHIDSVREVFGNPAYNPDHPPLGRVLIGIAHELSYPILSPDVPAGDVAVTCGRVASACGFAATILLIGTVAARWYGRTAGLIAALALVLMPRLFAHAHLAALETLTGLIYAATVLYVADQWRGERLRWRAVLIAGVLFGLALLTKIQAVLLPIPITLWALWRWRMRAVAPLAVFGLTGFAVFLLGWPWLWIGPLHHLAEYFGRATDRQTLYCWYAGHKWADTDVPWHYPAVMFAVTVPLGLQALGVLGAIGGGRSFFVLQHSDNPAAVSEPNADRRSPNAGRGLILLNVVWPLIFFALPGITVYDGTRLFLVVFPLWAVLIGRGGAELLRMLSRRWNTKRATVVLAGLLLLQSYGTIAMHPVQLSYYNLLVGGLRGASRLGFEVTYWGDSLTRSLLRDVQPEWARGPVFVAPVLHAFQLQELQTQTPELHAELRPFDETKAWNVRRLLLFRRRADSWRSLTPEPPNSRLRAEVNREGVQLSGLYEFEPGTFGEGPAGLLY